MRIQLFGPALLFVLAILSGCVDPTDTIDDSLSQQRSGVKMLNGCPVDAPSSFQCTEFDTHVEISGSLTINEGGVGVSAQMNKDLRVQNLTVTGGAVGFSYIPAYDCDCKIELKNSKFEGSRFAESAEENVALYGFGFKHAHSFSREQLGKTVRYEFENVSFAGFDGGISANSPFGELHMSKVSLHELRIGVDTNAVQSIHIDNVSATFIEGAAFDLQNIGGVILKNSAVAQSGFGFRDSPNGGNHQPVRFENFSSIGNEIGIEANDGQFLILDSTFEDNRDAAIRAKAQLWFNPEPLITVRNSSFTGNMVGIDLHDTESPLLVDAKNNWWGSPFGPSLPGIDGAGDPTESTQNVPFLMSPPQKPAP